jgi:hypothetical protein
MVQSEATHENAPRPEDVLLDPIRQAIRSFVGSVEASSKEMTVAAERFALDSAQLIRTAATVRRHTTRRAAHQESAVADLQRSASAVTEAASHAAATAREAAGAVSPSTKGENEMSEAETIAATSRRLQRLEEDISILTGLLRQVYDRVGSYPPAQPTASTAPASAARGPRRFRLRPQGHRLPRELEDAPDATERRYFAADR